jgi:ferredoxin
VAMEGNGPQSGTPRPMGVMLMSEDPVALDGTVCRLIDLDPALVPPLVHGEAFGLGRLSGVEYVGDSLEEFVAEGFDVNRSPRSTADRPGRRSRLMRRLVVPRPVIRPERCTQCGTCVEICPVSPKAIRFGDERRSCPPAHDYERCIRCYCCQEMCPEEAIEIDVPPLGRLIRR